MLTKAQLEEYRDVGAIVVADVLSMDEVQRLRRVTDEFVERARGVTTHNDIYDLEDSHTPDNPRVRRIKLTHKQHPEYGRLVRHPKILAVLRDLWGPDIRFDTAKLNMKSAGFGAPVEWHQDWAFYPHTNDNLAAVGVMFDDMELANGPLMIVPGSHRGPIFDHHADGIFCGAMDPANRDCDYSQCDPAHRQGRFDHGASRARRTWFRAQRLGHGSPSAAVPIPRRGCVAAARLSPRHRGIQGTDGLRPAPRTPVGKRAGPVTAPAREAARLALRKPEGYEEPLLRAAASRPRAGSRQIAQDAVAV